MPTISGGGAEGVARTLALGLSRLGFEVDLVLAVRAEAEALAGLESIRLIHLGKQRVLAALPKLVRYLRAERPAVLFSTLNHANLTALFARFVGQVRRNAEVIFWSHRGGHRQW